MFNCNCKWTEIILGVLILVFAWWATAYSQWIVTIAAVLLLLHALSCKNCGRCSEHQMKPVAKKKKR